MTTNHQVAEQALPAGYKQTEVGEIPEDWEVYLLSEIIQKTQLGGNYGNTEKETDYPLIKMGNLDRGAIKLDKLEYVTTLPNQSDLLKYGDVLFNTRNTLDLVGKVAIWRNELSQAYFNSNLMRLSFNEQLVSSRFYVNAIMNTKQFISALAGITTGTTSVAAIYTRDLVTLKLCLPPKQEQTAIANALSDVDALINELEKLIAKKQAIKTATLQQLLTGRTRLPQFALREDGTPKGYKQSELGEIPEDWDVKTIGQLFTITAGGDLRKNEYSDDQTEVYQYPIFSNAINKKGLYGYCSTYDYCGSYLTITARGGIGHAVARTAEFCAIGRLLVLKPTASSNCKFFEEFTNEYLEFANESTGVPQLTAPQVAKYSVMVPSEKEQTAIATILSDMDADIQTLQQSLSKTRQIKQGMMQELLTGKTRLLSKKSGVGHAC